MEYNIIMTEWMCTLIHTTIFTPWYLFCLQTNWKYSTYQCTIEIWKLISEMKYSLYTVDFWKILLRNTMDNWTKDGRLTKLTVFTLNPFALLLRLVLTYKKYYCTMPESWNNVYTVITRHHTHTCTPRMHARTTCTQHGLVTKADCKCFF